MSIYIYIDKYFFLDPLKQFTFFIVPSYKSEANKIVNFYFISAIR